MTKLATENSTHAAPEPLPRYWKVEAAHPPRVSFEFFPPKTDAAEDRLIDNAQKLAALGPKFVTCTYGAGGADRDRTGRTVTRLAEECGVPAAAHLTCVGASRDEIDAIARSYWRSGIRRIIALRGDPPEEHGGVAGRYKPRGDGYAYADNLVAGLKQVADFDISVSAYPETHPQAPSAAFDIDHLKRKFDAGADRAITQYFFEAETFLRFRDVCAAAGIDKPIIPGILPVSNFAQVSKFSSACGTRVPDWMSLLFDGLDDDPDTRRLVAVSQAVELCRRLQAHGVEDFHFYTLNRADLTTAIVRTLGLMPKLRSEDAPREQAA